MRNNNMKILETKNCILRPVVLNDYKALYDYYKIDYVVKYLPIKPHQSYADTKKFIKNFFLSNYKKGRIGHYAVVLKKENKVIGNAGFNNTSPKSRGGELGICINPKYWGMDLSTEITKKMIEYGFNDLNFDYVYAVTYNDNIHSQKSLNNLNFTHIDDYDKKFMNLENKSVKCSKYILYKEKFLNY